MIHEGVMILFYLIRHAESDTNTLVEDVVGGRSPESSLTARGIQQAAALGMRLKRENVVFDRVYTSPLRRAAHTTTIMCEQMGIDCSGTFLVEALTELSQGAFEGKPRREAYTPEVNKRLGRKCSFFTPPDGESMRMVQRRATSWLEDEILYNRSTLSTIKRHVEARGGRMPFTIAIVGHGIVFRCLLQYIMGITENIVWRIELDNASISKFLFRDDGWIPVCLNDSFHSRALGHVRGYSEMCW
jgi:broad specificity phosphatase PhoE